MNKTIKFNIFIDGKPIRDIEGLRENYNIDDIFLHYQSGLLHRWLEVRDYPEQLIKVKSIKTTDEMEISKSLISIFEILKNENEIKNSVYAIKSRSDKNNMLAKLEKANFNKGEVLRVYHSGYETLLFDIIKRKDDFEFIKKSIQIISEEYFQLFVLNYVNFYYTMINQAPLAIFASLMHPNIRDYFIYKEEADNEFLMLFNDRLKKIIKITYPGSALCVQINENETNIANDSENHYWQYFKIFGGVTDGYWKDLEVKGKKFMLINIDEGNFVRNSGKNGEELSRKDVFLQFPIVDGIDYKSNKEKHKLIYMEV